MEPAQGTSEQAVKARRDDDASASGIRQAEERIGTVNGIERPPDWL